MTSTARRHFRVAGVTFIPGYPGNLHRLRAAGANGDPGAERFPVVLIPNPENPHDPNAIEVHVPALGDHGMVGHLPRDLAARATQRLRNGETLQAEVVAVAVDPHVPEKPGLEVAVWAVKNERVPA